MTQGGQSASSKNSSGLAAYRETDRNARSDLNRDDEILKHLPLVHSVVERIAPFLPAHSIDRDDLFHAGVIGLIDAIDKFDPSRENAFSTYAVLRIRGSVMDELRARDAISRGMRQRAKEYQQAVSHLTNKLGQMPSDEELAEYLDINQEELLELERQQQLSIQVSLDKPTGEHGNIGDLIKSRSEQNPAENMERADAQRVLTEAIDSLKEQERLIIKLYYFEQLLMKEIALVLDVTESRICQIHSRVVALLKQRLSGSGLDLP